MTERLPLPENKNSLEYAVVLFEQLTEANLTDPDDLEWIVEHLRSASELALWGDKHDHEIADYLILESGMVSFFADIVSTPDLDGRIYVQCIQSVVILIQNYSRESTLFFILSNGKFNRFIDAKLDFSDEDIVSHFVSFLKSVTLRLTAKNIIPLFCSGGSFPLLASAMNSALLTHDDRMVRTSVRQVIAQMLRINDPSVAAFAQGCVPRLIDDLGTFLEAQLRNLSIYVEDETVSQTAVELYDEDIADEGLYLVDLLAGCITEEEKARMSRTMRQHILERLLIHAHDDSDGSDVVVSTVVFMFLSRWLRTVPRWFLESCFKSGNKEQQEQEQQQEEEESSSSSNNNSAAATATAGETSNQQQLKGNRGPVSPNSKSSTGVFTKSLSWALFAALSRPRSEEAIDELLLQQQSSSNNNNDSSSYHFQQKSARQSHGPPSTVTRAALCLLGTIFYKLAAEEGKKQNISDWDRSNDTLLLLVQLVRDSMAGMAARIDRTSCYNCAVLSFLAEKIFSDNENENEKNKKKGSIELEQFFKSIVIDSELLTPGNSSLRLEVLMAIQGIENGTAAAPMPQSQSPMILQMQLKQQKAFETATSNNNDNNNNNKNTKTDDDDDDDVNLNKTFFSNAPVILIPPESALDVLPNDQWRNFIEDLRYPLNRQLRFREPVSQSERVTHRASVISFLRNQLFGKNAVSSQEEGKSLLGAEKLAKRLLFSKNNNNNSSISNSNKNNNAIATGMIVNEEISLEGGFPSVFISISGNMLDVLRVEFGGTVCPPSGSSAYFSLTNRKNNSNNNEQTSQQKTATPPSTSSSSSQATSLQQSINNNHHFQVPIVSLSVTLDVSRPFVVHFCSPQCCGIAPFSISFSSRKVASKVSNVLSHAANELKSRMLKTFVSDMSF